MPNDLGTLQGWQFEGTVFLIILSDGKILARLLAVDALQLVTGEVRLTLGVGGKSLKLSELNPSSCSPILDVR